MAKRNTFGVDETLESTFSWEMIRRGFVYIRREGRLFLRAFVLQALAMYGGSIRIAPYSVFNLSYTLFIITSPCSSSATLLITAQLCGLSHIFASASVRLPITFPSSVNPLIKRSSS